VTVWVTIGGKKKHLMWGTVGLKRSFLHY